MNPSHPYICQVMRWQDGLQSYQFQGTGILISPNCILTCKHSVTVSELLLPAKNLLIKFPGKNKQSSVSLINISEQDDLALLYIQSSQPSSHCLPLLTHYQHHIQFSDINPFCLAFSELEESLVEQHQNLRTAHTRQEWRLENVLAKGMSMAPVLGQYQQEAVTSTVLIGLATNPNNHDEEPETPVISTHRIHRFLAEHSIPCQCIDYEPPSILPESPDSDSFMGGFESHAIMRYMAGILSMLTAGMVMATFMA